MNLNSKWKGTPDDLTLRFKDYILKVKQMGKGRWWWACYYLDKEIAFDYPPASTKQQAQTYAFENMRKHITIPQYE